MIDIYKANVKAYAGFCRLLGDENRLQILFSLEGGQKSVSSIIEFTGLSQTLVSYHLRTLREQRLVKTDRKGPFVLYTLVNEQILTWIDEVKYFLDRDEKTASPGNGTSNEICCKTRKSDTTK